MTLIERINAQLIALDLAPLNSEQVLCLIDPARVEEAADMLDDLTVRCGLRLQLPEGDHLGAFVSEEDARHAAEEQARIFDAVCIEELATDDSRSGGGNEYHVIAFSGPDGVLASSYHGQAVARWLAGRQI
jgi:hypothetical protein